MVSEGLATPLYTWSYQPSESSYVMKMAVLFQVGSCSIELTSFTSQFCSSIGSDVAGWPVW